MNPTTAATITFGGTSPLSLYFNGINHGLGFARWNAMGPITGGVDMKNTLRVSCLMRGDSRSIYMTVRSRVLVHKRRHSVAVRQILMY